MADQRDVENLHREASGFYLKGDLQSALRVWREILTLRPQDVRAREGVRLCDQLTDTAEVESPPGPAPQAKDTDQLDDLLKDLDARLAFDQIGPEAGPDRKGGEEKSADSEAGLWRWDEGTETGQASGTPEVQAEPAQPKTEPPGGVGDVAAVELKRRVNELLDGVRSCREAGDLDEALAMIERVMILDEENQAALDLKAEIERDAEAGGPESDVDASEPETEVTEPIEYGAVQADPEASPLPALDIETQALPIGEIELEDLPDTEYPVDADFDEVEPPPEEEQATRKSVELSALGSRGPLLYGIIGVVLLAVAAFVILRTIGSGEPGFTPTVPPAETDPVPAENPPQEPAADPSGNTVGPVNDPSSAKRFVAFLADARAAFAAEDFEAAVLACNAALEIRPGHQGAVELMRQAAEGYREQEELAGKWTAAREAFESGNYQDALRLFYRLPESEDRAAIERYTFNGWYNLGVIALRSRHCDQALEHLDEARQIFQDTPDLTAAYGLVEDCRNADPEAFWESVRALPLHGLED